MARQDIVIERVGIEVPQSLSDRPWYVRWGINLRTFLINKPLGTFGLAVIALMVVCAVFAPWISRYDPNAVFEVPNPAYDPELAEEAKTDPSVRLQHPPETFIEGSVIARNQGPSSEHWLGTDGFGHDLYARIIYGSRVSLFVGIGASLLAVIAGTVFGVVSAYFGGVVDMIIQRLADSFQAFPALVLLLLMIQVIESPTIEFITLALALVGVPPVIRIVRSSVLSAREDVYVTAAVTIGASDNRIMARHILPNIVAPIIVIFSITIGVYILAEASLSFLGYGDPTAISWGKMVNEGRQLGPAKPLMALFTGLAITISVLGFNLAGDALRDALDPRLRGSGGRSGF